MNSVFFDKDLIFETKNFLRAFGLNLRKIRESNSMSQEEFSEICNISRAYYGRIERGEHSPTLDICFRIANAMQLSVSDLFFDLPE